MSGLHTFRFQKRERLTSKKKIEELFRNGSSFHFYPLLVRFQTESGDSSNHRVLFSVPKKQFRHAVMRNLIKRRMREAYRLNKYRLNDVERKECFTLAFIYTGKEILPFQVIAQKLIRSLERLKLITETTS